MKRAEYLAEVIRLYLLAPDTPRKASRRDWAIAATFYRREIPLQTVAHAVRLATLRRHLRDPQLGPLEPIHSLGYFRTVVEQMGADALDPGYIDYTAWKYHDYFGGDLSKARLESQDTAVSDDR